MSAPRRWNITRDTFARRQPDLTVLMENVRKAHNFSALMRSCDAVGIHEVHGVWPSATPRPFGLTSSGAEKWMTVIIHDRIEQAISALQQRSFQVVAAHIGATSVDYRQIDYRRPTAIMLGAELDGVSAPALAQADAHIAVPMHGMIESLNISVAAAVILFESERQRREAGMYDDCRLSPTQYKQTLFEWAYPKLAEHCKTQETPYPRLDSDGAIVHGHDHTPLGTRSGDNTVDNPDPKFDDIGEYDNAQEPG